MYSACSPVVLHTVPYINHMLINVLGKLDVEALATAKNKAWSPNGVIIKKIIGKWDIIKQCSI